MRVYVCAWGEEGVGVAVAAVLVVVWGWEGGRPEWRTLSGTNSFGM